ncbi:MAG: hypothetical protein AAB802_00660 [Patescibacteria group bacterium]
MLRSEVSEQEAPKVQFSGRVAVPKSVDQWPVVDTVSEAQEGSLEGLHPDLLRTAHYVRAQLEGSAALSPIILLEDGSAFQIADPDDRRFPKWTPTGEDKATPTFYPNPGALQMAQLAKATVGKQIPASGPGSGERAPTLRVVADEGLSGGIDTFGVVGPE